ncbi:MAG: hypothetical protein RLZZ546_1605 [Bacteroidota bacterium]|jgi:glycosyltransferase involved in cell wall biosynthesis
MSVTIKLAFDAKRLFFNNTGLGNYSRTLVKNLKEFFPQYEIHLFTPSIVENKETYYFLNGSFHIHTCESFMPNFFWRSVYMSKEIDRLKIDIFHGLSNELPIIKPKNAKTLVTIHDLICELYPEHFASYDAFIYRQKSRYACKVADKILSISHSTTNDLINIYKIHPSKIEVIYQSINSNFLQNENYISSKKYYLYVGSISERKRLINVIMAMNLLDEKYKLPLVIIGNGDVYKKKVIHLAKRYNMLHLLDFKGNISNEDIMQLYDDALCLLMPSIYEGFGIPIAEALFRKIPVITSNTSSLPEAAGPGAILIKPDDIYDLKMAMMQMFDTSNWDKFSNEGYKYAINNFDGRAQATKLDEMYRSLLKNK